ncbi:MAG: hypothetical protein QOJ79_1434 [Actinomycetota bacterium]|nr:hypothetical protein [Actinomycetota bacterium]
MTTALDYPLGHVVPARTSTATRGWAEDYARTLVGVDALVLSVVAFLGVRLRFGSEPGDFRSVSYYAVAVALVVLWMAALGVSRCYEPRFHGWGTEEFRRVGNASVRLCAVVTFLVFAFQLPLSRAFVALTLPAGTVALVGGRYAARRVLHAARAKGQCLHKVLLVGSHPHIKDLSTHLRREQAAGFEVVGACVPGAREQRTALDGHDVPVVGALVDIPRAIRASGADTVAIAASHGMNGTVLRQLTYELEGSGIDVLLAPALTNVAGTRISIRPVAGVPLLHVDEPELSGGRKIVKAVFDRSVALIALVLLSPLLLAMAAAVRLTSNGPALFKQERVGIDGSTFKMLKFRSMHVNAESMLDKITSLNESDGVLFKMKKDPRVTRVGAFMRRYSIDEFPQLINVVLGNMSLVGPRPPLPGEVMKYDGHTGRRLMVKPGLTGLWQVSGRSDLSWEDTVRLDLHYVDNWSLALDISVLAKTAMTVIRGAGAY